MAFFVDFRRSEHGTFKHIEQILRDYPNLESYIHQRRQELLYPHRQIDDNGDAQTIHNKKIEALQRIVEEAQGQPILVFYIYKHDLERIQQALPEAKALDIKAGDVKKWNAGEIPILLAHPQSAGHGLNLQAGGHIIVWFGLTWSLEFYQQANARLDRQGQTKPVIVHHLVATGTMDERVMDVLEGKRQSQDALLDAVKAKIDEYGRD